MSDTTTQLLNSALSLPETERRELRDALQDSLPDHDGELSPDDWEEAWADEINRRVAEIRAGTVTMIPAEEVMARLKEKYG